MRSDRRALPEGVTPRLSTASRPLTPEQVPVWPKLLRPVGEIREPQLAFVYFVQAEVGGLIKIGTAADPIGRVYNMQSNCPITLKILGCIGGDYRAERDIHRKFAEERRHGEWFEPSARLIEFVAAIIAEQGVPREVYGVVATYRPLRAEKTVGSA